MSEERKQCASDLTDQAVDTGCAFSGTGFVSGAAAYLCVTGIHIEGPGTGLYAGEADHSDMRDKGLCALRFLTRHWFQAAVPFLRIARCSGLAIQERYRYRTALSSTLSRWK